MKPLQDTKDLFSPPPTWKQGAGDSRSTKALTDDHVVPVIRYPWAADAHGASGADDFCDAVWGATEGQRDARQLKNMKEMK